MKKFIGTSINSEEKINVKLEDGFITLEFEEIENSPELTFESLEDFWDCVENSNIVFTDEAKKAIKEEMLYQPLILFDRGRDTECGGCGKCRDSCNSHI